MKYNVNIKDNYVYLTDDKGQTCFAEKELNLYVLVLPNWRDWEIKQAALQLNLTKGIDSIRPDLSTYKVYEEGFIAGYNHNKAKMYTDEDLRNAIEMARDKEYICLANGKDKICYCKRDDDCDHRHYKTKDEIIQSLQKLPKYIVMESEYKDGYGNWFTYDKDFWDKKGNKPKFGIRYKTITNSEDKQEGIIKEIKY